MKRRSALALSIPALAASVVLAACGGSDMSGGATDAQPERKAAAGFTADTATCDERKSYTYRGSMINRLPFAITLQAGEYDCNDWSGANTPGTAFTGKTIPAGGRISFVLEPAYRTERNWTMAVTAASSGEMFGTARLYMPQTSLDSDRIMVRGAVAISRGEGSCDLLPLGATSAPATPLSAWPDFFTSTPLGVISRNGRVNIASFCTEPGV